MQSRRWFLTVSACLFVAGSCGSISSSHDELSGESDPVAFVQAATTSVVTTSDMTDRSQASPCINGHISSPVSPSNLDRDDVCGQPNLATPATGPTTTTSKPTTTIQRETTSTTGVKPTSTAVVSTTSTTFDDVGTVPPPPGSNEVPAVGSVSGVLRDGNQVLISGSSFGSSGPDVHLFDDFKRGVDGDLVTLAAPVGSWHSVQDHHAPYYGVDNQGNVTGHFIRDNSVGRIFAQFADTQEIYISYRVMIPPGKHFPNSGAPNTFPAGSQWKLTWLMDGERGSSGNDDLVIPTWGNGTYFYIAGNDNAFQLPTGRPGSSDNWFSFQGWNRFSVYMQGGQIPDQDPGTTWSQGMSEEFGQSVFQSSDTLFDGDDTADGYKFEDDAISRWNRFNVPGWHRGGDDNAAAMYDDIYIATGPNARARIEVGNSPNYGDSTVLAIVTPDSWQDDSITATIRQGLFQDGEQVYIFVINSNGHVSSGYPLVFGH